MKKFLEVTAQLEQVLREISLDEFDISNEVREQVELVHTQFKRAKEQFETPDDELYNDVLSVYSMSSDANVKPAVLRRLAERLQLMTISDLKEESLALHEIVVANGGDPQVIIEKLSMLLKIIKDFVQTQNAEIGIAADLKVLPSNEKSKIPVTPDDFRCPISLERMKDPVTVAAGQTYDRRCIEKWLEAGHDTCPKKQQKLPNTSLTPNYVLCSFIAQWCEVNGMDPPKRSAQPDKVPSACFLGECAKIIELLCKLSSQNIEDQRLAAGELRLLAKRNADNCVCIAEARAISLLVSLPSTFDAWTQEHAVTALLTSPSARRTRGK